MYIRFFVMKLLILIKFIFYLEKLFKVLVVLFVNKGILFKY